MVTISHEEYLKKLHISKPHLLCLSSYKGSTQPIKLQCNICNHIWSPLAGNILLYKGKGCPNCKSIEIKKRRTFSNEEFLNKLFYITNNITPLESYKKMNQKILCKCNTCKYEWNVLPHSLLRGIGCPKCNGYTVKSNEEFLNKLHSSFPHLYSEEFYKGALTKINIRCSICGNIRKVAPASLFVQKYGCPFCAKNKKLDEITLKLKMPSNIQLLESFISSNIKVKCKCLICGKIWKANPRLLSQGLGCMCRKSKGELKIKEFLEKNFILFEQEKRFNDCKNKNKLPFDFYLLDYNTCIEYDGIQHYQGMAFNDKYSSLEYIQTNDKIKTEYCKKNNIHLIRIPYTKFNEIEVLLKQFIVDNRV